MRIFSKEELVGYNGKNDQDIYICYRVKVYDVTRSFLWKNGEHQVLHKAGMDLTKDLKDAPHGAEFIYRFPIVGIME